MAGGRSGSGGAGSANGGNAGVGGPPSTGGATDPGGAGGDPGGGGDAGEAGSGGGTTDTTPPTVLSVTPADDATGVPADARIVITFSERMNPGATEAAYESADLPRNQVSPQWNGDETVLTLTPNNPLNYAVGTDPAMLTARAYTFTITRGALDAQGNPLARDYEHGFRTMRRVNHTLRPVPNTDNANGQYWALTRNAVNPVGALCPTAALTVGAPGGNPWTTYGFIAFGISAIPADVTFESAIVSANQAVVVGTPFVALGSVLDLFQHTPLPVNQGIAPGNIPVSTNSPRVMGTFSRDTMPGLRSRDVLTALLDDYENRAQRGNMSTYRLGFYETEILTPFDPHYVEFECASIKLDTTYILP